MVLTPKNVHALRTLFNVAHRLHHQLGGAWTLVLDNLNSLDRILEAPSTTTQVRSLRPSRQATRHPMQVIKTCHSAGRGGSSSCTCCKIATTGMTS